MAYSLRLLNTQKFKTTCIQTNGSAINKRRYYAIPFLQVVNVIVFGFSGNTIKVLLAKNRATQDNTYWSLIGGFVQPHEKFVNTSKRLLKLNNLEMAYYEQLHTFSYHDADEMIISTAYFALVNIQHYERPQNNGYYTEWYNLEYLPLLPFEQHNIIAMARKKLQYKAAFHPIVFVLLPQKFTMPSLCLLYEHIFNKAIDKRNFCKRVLAIGLLIKLTEKDTKGSKRGAYYYQLNKPDYYEKLQSFINFIPNPSNI